MTATGVRNWTMNKLNKLKTILSKVKPTRSMKITLNMASLSKMGKRSKNKTKTRRSKH
jgi:hypothetical protein